MIQGIRGKLLLIMGGIVFGVISVITYLHLSAQYAIMEKELNNRTELMKANLRQQGLLLSRAYQSQAEADIASKEMFKLMQKLTLGIEINETLSYAIMFDHQYQVFLNTLEPEKENQQNTGLAEKLAPLDDTRQIAHTTHTNEEGESFFEYVIPVLTDRDDFYYLSQLDTNETITAPGNTASVWGYIVLGFSKELLKNQIKASEDKYNEQIESRTIQTFYFSMLVLLLTYIIISALSKKLTNPIVFLTHHLDDIAKDGFSTSKKLPRHPSKDEIGTLYDRFILMAEHLRNSYKQLEEINQTLEEKVALRTKELQVNNVALTQTLNELETRQQQLIQSEKMAALGQLIAGIAHEINTPLGAVKASVDNTQKSLQFVIEQLPSIIETATKEQIEIGKELFILTTQKPYLTTREERQIRRKIRNELTAKDVADADWLAEILIDMGITDEGHELLDKLAQQSDLSFVNFIHQLSAVRHSSDTIRNAVSRAAKIVFALKHYAHQNPVGVKTTVNINEGLANVLVLYRNNLRQGCELKESYGTLPEIQCFADELNQVWTNLIHNALQAMQNHGVLSIETKVENDNIIVNITDSGDGIPEEIQPTIFDPFFTTKPAGEGSGLGLDICKKIVEKHKGEISFTSQPGKTVFTVTLPVHPAT